MKFTVGIIADSTRERFNALKQELGLGKIFAVMVSSAEVGMCKYGRKIFEEALRRAKVLPNEAVIIDDDPKNLKVPAQMGCATIHYDPTRSNILELIEQLNALGVDVGKKTEKYPGYL